MSTKFDREASRYEVG